jgi:hypothetical protein
MARKIKEKPTSFKIPLDHFFHSFIGRCSKERFLYLQIPEFEIVGPKTKPRTEDEFIIMDADHLCRGDFLVVCPVNESDGFLRLSEAGWNAHKHLLVGKIDPVDFASLEQLTEELFEDRRQYATKQRQKLRNKIAKLEEYWPHLRDD